MSITVQSTTKSPHSFAQQNNQKSIDYPNIILQYPDKERYIQKSGNLFVVTAKFTLLKEWTKLKRL
jgi:hypothetical protein